MLLPCTAHNIAGWTIKAVQGWTLTRWTIIKRDQALALPRDLQNELDYDALFDAARVYVDDGGGTRIAYSADPDTFQRVNRVFETRTMMHRSVYRHGCVVLRNAKQRHGLCNCTLREALSHTHAGLLMGTR